MEYIRLVNVSKEIKRRKVLKNISYCFEGNKVYGIRGENGSGKTMLLRAVCGLMSISGSVEFDGKGGCEGDKKPEIGAMIEQPGFLKEFTGKENLELIGLLCDGVDANDINTALTDVGLSPEDDRKYGKYSLGMKQRLGIAQAILKYPELIALDEPTNAIDEEGISRLVLLIKKLKAKGCTIIIASHDRGFLEQTADCIITMKEGRII